MYPGFQEITGRFEQDKTKLEKIQRRATKLVPSLRKTDYETRLGVF